MKERSLAESILVKFCELYKNRDMIGILSLCAQNINMWGTGLDEYRVGLNQVEDQLKRDWGQSEKGEIEILSFVPAPKDSLWTAAICNAKVTINGKEYILENLRGTIIIEKENGVWKISHMHTSFPDYRNAENSSFPVGEEK